MTAKKINMDRGSDAEAMTVNALDLLAKDHRAVDALFSQFEQTEDEDEKVSLAQQICTELTIHAAAEEKVFYPAARGALEGSAELVDEAEVEHRSLKTLIAEIDGCSAADALFDASVKVLKEYVKHHVREEEQEMFPRLRESDLDLEALGSKLMTIKANLQERVGEPKPPRAGARPKVHVPDVSAKGGKSASKSSGRGRARSTSRTAHSAH